MTTHLLKALKDLSHAAFPLAARFRFGIIGKRIQIIGITGTDGKSSSVVLSAAMLRAAGNKVAHYSSVSYHDGEKEYPNDSKMTTPGKMQLHRFLDTAQKRGCTHAVVEITSQGILQHRHRFLGFTLVGITNITPEHIEAHGNFENYRSTKLSLVRQLLPHNRGLVIDEMTLASLPANPIGVHIETATLLRSDRALIEAKVVENSPQRSVVELSLEGNSVSINAHLGGPFAASNIVFAATIASVCGVPLRAIKTSVESFERIPGRFEILSERPLVVVDYAHTISALENLLPYVREHTTGTLVHVFGAAGGGRDRYKRPIIARISEGSADVSILTEENSFDEPIERILDDIRTGFSSSHLVHVRPHREDAVQLGLSLLTGAEDTLLLTAKGSESVIAGPKGSKRPYNERTYIQWLLDRSSSA